MCPAMLLVASLFLGAVAQDPPAIWRFPFQASKYVVTNPRDQLPDFSLAADGSRQGGEFTSSTISCPSTLQKTCCTLCHGENCAPCCNSTKYNRACSGGMYCNAAGDYVKKERPELIPNFIGLAKLRKAINRTRENILQRATGWLAVHVPYHGCHVGVSMVETCAKDDDAKCPQYGHTGSCCGFVSMAVGVNEVQGHAENRIQIDCKNLAPGDFVANVAKSGGISHWWMFREWKTPGVVGPMRLYQMGGGGGAANMHTQTKGSTFCKRGQKSCINCFKYPHLINDTYAAPALEDQFFEDAPLEYSENLFDEQDAMEVMV